MFLKAESPILFKPFGNFILVIDEQFSNADEPIEVTPSGMTISVSIEHPINVLFFTTAKADHNNDIMMKTAFLYNIVIFLVKV